MITRGQLETQERGRAGTALPAGHAARNTSRGVCDYVRLVLRERIECEKEQQRRQEGEKECERPDESYAMCVIWCLALGERLRGTLNASAGLLEVIIVDAKSKLIEAVV